LFCFISQFVIISGTSQTHWRWIYETRRPKISSSFEENSNWKTGR
jgi:hypothetical protein